MNCGMHSARMNQAPTYLHSVRKIATSDNAAPARTGLPAVKDWPDVRIALGHESALKVNGTEMSRSVIRAWVFDDAAVLNDDRFYGLLLKFDQNLAAKVRPLRDRANTVGPMGWRVPM